MNLTCIMCPKGCEMKITKKDNTILVNGNSCPRGEIYAKEELTAPTRILTSIIKTNNGVIGVKTSKPIPKEKIHECLIVLKNLKVKNAKFGDILIKNILNTDANIIVTREAIKN